MLQIANQIKHFENLSSFKTQLFQPNSARTK